MEFSVYDTITKEELMNMDFDYFELYLDYKDCYYESDTPSIKLIFKKEDKKCVTKKKKN